MKHNHFLIGILSLIFGTFAEISCVTQDVEDDTRLGNFQAFWRIIDQHYCFFSLKAEEYGLDWNEVYSSNKGSISENMSEKQLFEVLANMSYELRDGHVNLYASHDVARYGDWFDSFPMNQSDSLERIYLGTSSEYAQSAGLKYKILSDNIGYIRCSTFENVFGDGNLNEIMRELATCNGLIVDVRSNGGGQMTAAIKLASLFYNETDVAAYISHKTGTGHDDFSTPEAIKIDPLDAFRWQKPVAILTNRRTYSAANSFVMFVKGLEQVTIVGDTTGGGAGLPFSSELPNGWLVRFSACPMYDREMVLTEQGIEPDVAVDITDEDYQNGVDTIIETARALLKETTAGDS